MTLPDGPWPCILADPPWRFETYSEAGWGKAPQRHYPCEDLETLKAMPVGEIAARDAYLFLWATFPMLPQALALMAAWGFAYRAGGAWGKQSATGRRLAFGPGYIFRSAAEPLLVGARGSPRWLSRSERNLWLAPIREHSRKPDCVHEMIERACAGPRLELFARQRRPGWEAWGNQTDKFASTEFKGAV